MCRVVSSRCWLSSAGRTALDAVCASAARVVSQRWPCLLASSHSATPAPIQRARYECSLTHVRRQLRRYRAIIEDRTARRWICCSGAASSVGAGGTRHSGGTRRTVGNACVWYGVVGGRSVLQQWGTHTSKAVRGGAFYRHRRSRQYLACGSHAMLANSCAWGSGGAAWRKERERRQQRGCCCLTRSLTFTPACRPPSRRR